MSILKDIIEKTDFLSWLEQNSNTQLKQENLENPNDAQSAKLRQIQKSFMGTTKIIIIPYGFYGPVYRAIRRFINE